VKDPSLTKPQIKAIAKQAVEADYSGVAKALVGGVRSAPVGVANWVKGVMRDSKFRKAVDSGDKATYEKIMSERASEAGLLKEWQHASKVSFNEFDMSRAGSRVNSMGRAAYFIDEFGDTDYGNVVRRFYIRMNNPVKISRLSQLDEAMGRDRDLEISKEMVLSAQNKGTDLLLRSGYDSVAYTRFDGKVLPAIFYPKNIKLSDALTFDDAGRVIPPSKRFDFNSRDIRY
jgi:hypothetical protein